MGDFWAIEIFSVGSFVMLRIDGGWPEKLVRVRLLNWERKLETRELKIETRSADLAGRRGLGLAPEERNGLNRRAQKGRSKGGLEASRL